MSRDDPSTLRELLDLHNESSGWCGECREFNCRTARVLDQVVNQPAATAHRLRLLAECVYDYEPEGLRMRLDEEIRLLDIQAEWYDEMTPTEQQECIDAERAQIHRENATHDG